ncbi:amidohydrolase family protein [Heyndrickxia sp. NPDC080065]|uniref:amidohydrolase family protein n=1 Tax=Heyndrickxia sp. NPDC080065 TaxID=3390568 RepID=UPI003CFCAACA
MRYLLKNAWIIDVERATNFQGSIEIDNGFIKNIFHQDSDTPVDIKIIDVKGKYIIPGLIDMHCHINEGYAPQFVASGVTTVRNTAGNVLQLKSLIDSPIHAPTPRVYSADRMIDGSPGLWGPTSTGNFVTDDPNEARNEVKRQAEAGAKFIKVYGWLAKEVMEAVVTEAKNCGLEVSCDLIHSSKVNALNAAKMGVTWFEHASGFIQALYPNWHTQADQEEWGKVDWKHPDQVRIQRLCEQMLQYDVKLCPTMIIHDQIEKLPDYWYVKNDVTKTLEGEGGLANHWMVVSEQSEALKRQLGMMNQFTKVVAKTYFELGGTVVAGTDTPAGVWTPPGMALHRELELFVEIGFTEMEALKAATIHAARSIHLNDIGLIRAGAIADLVILNSNPLKDIRNTKDINRIIKSGRLFTQKEILDCIPSNEYCMEQYEKFEAEFFEMMGKF